MRGIHPLGGYLICLLFLAGTGASAREFWRSDDAYLDVGGTLRQIAVTTRGTSVEAFTAAFEPSCLADSEAFANCPSFDVIGNERVTTSITRLRLRVEGRANKYWSATVSADNELWAGDLDSFESQFGTEIDSGAFLDASGQVGDNPSFHYSLYRAHVNFESQYFEAVIGRQRIPWGVGRLWNPIDRFNAIRPLATEGDQSPGVDAITARILFSGFTQIEAVFAPGNDFGDHSGDHDFAVRFQGVAGNVDYGLVAGVFDKATTVGFDLAANLGDAAGRAEIVFTHPTRNVWPIHDEMPSRLDDFWQVVLSLDYNIDWGSGLYILAEHLYNGNALGFGSGKAGTFLPFFERVPFPPSSFAVGSVSRNRFGGSQVITRSSQLTGLQANYQFTPEFGGNFLVLFDWDGTSSVFFPSLTYNPLAWLDITFAFQIGVGATDSEFGETPATGFLLADVYF